MKYLDIRVRSQSARRRRSTSPARFNLRARALAIAVLVCSLMAGTLAQSSEKGRAMLITDFTNESADLGWRVVNDNVMGGRSEGGFAVDEGVLQFAGRTNTRGGGFSSIRTAPPRLDLSGNAGIRVRVRGDGRRYTWRLATDARYYGREVSYWADFETVRGEWQEIDIPFAAFVPRFRGRTLDGPVLNLRQVQGMGLMIYDKLDGNFELSLDSVRTYPLLETASVNDYRSSTR